MTVLLNKRLLNTEEYHKMAEVGILQEGDRLELIHGEIIEMSPIGSKHAGCINRVNALLSELLGRKAIISIQNPLQIDKWSEPEPDIAVLKATPDYYSHHHPTAQDVLLLIEVADSSIDYDREVKMALYANAGIPEYWIIDLAQAQVEAYRIPKKNTYRVKETVRTTDTLYSETLKINIEVDALLGKG